MILSRSYQDKSDEELMALVQQRDSKAFELIYDRYSERMVNYFFKMLWQDEEKAQDFMQDLFTKLIAKPQHFDLKRNFKTWFFSVAHNMCKNEYRKQGIRSDVHGTVSYDVAGSSGSESPQAIDRDKFNDELEKALGELDEVKKTTFLMRYNDEMSIKEISEIMECSEGTVKSRLFYTLKMLNTRLKAYEGLLLWIMTALAGLSN